MQLSDDELITHVMSPHINSTPTELELAKRLADKLNFIELMKIRFERDPEED